MVHMEQNSPRLPKGRAQLVRVLAAAGDVVHVDDVASALELDRASAAGRLSRWTEQGWLRRVGRGAYIAASIDTMGSGRVLIDPWILVPALFSPGYVGGRTAAEHWDLTEQIFNDVLVMTAQAVRERRQERDGARFSLKHVDERKLFGTNNVWRQHTRVPVSDVHRTVVDMLDDPAVGAGIQHVADCLAKYFHRADRDDRKLVEYSVRLGNGAVFKRLGFLTERLRGGAELVRLCEQRLSGGHAKLDPAQDGSHVVSRWRLRVPHSWALKDTA